MRLRRIYTTKNTLRKEKKMKNSFHFRFICVLKMLCRPNNAVGVSRNNSIITAVPRDFYNKSKDAGECNAFYLYNNLNEM